jgi:hypothetical protein
MCRPVAVPGIDEILYSDGKFVTAVSIAYFQYGSGNRFSLSNKKQ